MSRGGARQGSGRKKLPNRKVTISFRISPECKEEAQRMKENGADIPAMFEEMIKKGTR